MQPLFLGSHPFIDFLNTLPTPQGEAIELIGDGEAFIEWLSAARLLDEATAAKMSNRRWKAQADAAAAEARGVREWARKWLGRWRDEPDASYGAELREVNRLLENVKLHRQVVRIETGLETVETSLIETPADLIGLIALQLSALLTQEEPSLLKSCAGEDCSLWFLDRTKAHRRIYCSATACGNRAKVSAFRARSNTR